ncbi:MAG: hypothetical protein ACRD3E_12100, partial [Terriglobales bacterium]
PVLWSAAGYDWRAKSAQQIVDNVARKVRGGEVILLHDGDHRAPDGDRSLSVAATDLLLRRYRDEGYEFVNVSQMMQPAAASGGNHA